MQETLENHKVTLRESAIQHVTCGRGGVPYDYDHTAEASAPAGYSMTGREIPWEEARQKAGARLTPAFPGPGRTLLRPGARHVAGQDHGIPL